MAEIKVNDEHFWQFNPLLLPEANFERILLGASKELFPDYFVVPFKKLIESPQGKTIPDLIMISRDYKSWALTEVETISDNADKIFQQMEKISTSRFGKGEIDYFLRKQSEPDIDKKKAEYLLSSVPPEYLVIDNGLNQDLKIRLSVIDVKYMVVEVYKNFSNMYSFRIVGEIPGFLMTHICKVSVHSYVNQILIIGDPEKFRQVKYENTIYLLHQGMSSEWKLEVVSNKLSLVAISRSPFEAGSSFNIYSFRNYLVAGV